jgi:hypothetical protein
MGKVVKRIGWLLQVNISTCTYIAWSFVVSGKLFLKILKFLSATCTFIFAFKKSVLKMFEFWIQRIE